MGKLINKFRFITVDHFEKDEEYFHEMSKKGLHFDHYKFPYYKFKQGEPANYRYQTDFQKLEPTEKESYLQLFYDDGWELVCEYPGVYGTWFYFRKPITTEANLKIFTDPSSMIDLYKKIRNNWLIFFLIMTPLILLPSLSHDFTRTYWTWPAIIIWSIVAILYVKMALTLTFKINRLKREEKD